MFNIDFIILICIFALLLLSISVSLISISYSIHRIFKLLDSYLQSKVSH